MLIIIIIIIKIIIIIIIIIKIIIIIIIIIIVHVGLITGQNYCVNICFYCWINSTINFYWVNFYSVIKVVIS